jgi:ferritin-like metal-binding protein YciE
MGGKGTFGPGIPRKANYVRELDGVWRVERRSGALPPLPGVVKRIHGTRGRTIFPGLPPMPFEVQGLSLHYKPPFVGLVDLLEPDDDDGFRGRATVGGRTFGTFAMRRQPMGTELEAQLVKHIDEAVAMEQNVVRMLDGMIATTEDDEIRGALRQHKLETETHLERMQKRLEAHGATPSMVREAGGILGALMKSVLDLARAEKAGRNARDGFATEHMEIASYELLSRIAERAGDEETATAAREIIVEEQHMADEIAANWDRFAELSLEEEGVTL